MVKADEDEVCLYTGGFDPSGFVYRPDGKSPESVGKARRYEHLFGPWWWFKERF
jgi:hypothetical protein